MDLNPTHLVKKNVMNVQIYHDTNMHYIIGDPIRHSLSPVIYNTLYQRYEMNTVCLTAHVPKGQLKTFFDARDLFRICTVNVTIPHKTDVLAFADTIDEEADLYQSANTIAIRNDQLHAYSTDAQGFVLSMAKQDVSFADQHVAILGAGGAAAPIALRAAREKAASILILARRIESANDLTLKIQQFFDIPCKTALLQDSASHIASSTLLINTTPLGMAGFGLDFPAFDFLEHLPKNAVVYDIVYNPSTTALLHHAQAQQRKTIGGIGMLIWQAFAAFEIFYGQLPNSHDFAAVQSALSSQGFFV